MGKTKAPWRPLPEDEEPEEDEEGPGKGRDTVGVGPQSTAGRMSWGMKLSRGWRCGWKSIGLEVQSGVKSERKFVRCCVFVPGAEVVWAWGGERGGEARFWER
jgi:hypothetical protein